MRKGLVVLIILIICLAGGRASFANRELGESLEKEVFRLKETIEKIEEKLTRGEEILEERGAIREIGKRLKEIDGKLG